MAGELLRLDNQLCFPFYAVSRLITRAYQPMLDALGVTYPQYLVLMVLWEHGRMQVGEIADILLLSTATLTPLLKRLEQNGIVRRQRSDEDERVVQVALTDAGRALKRRAARIPEKLVAAIDYPVEKLEALRESVREFLNALAVQAPEGAADADRPDV